jgi:hypothetical protein
LRAEVENMPDKKDTGPQGSPGSPPIGAHGLPTRESIDLLTRLLQEFDRRCPSPGGNVPPEVERDIAVVSSVLAGIERALKLDESPVTMSSIDPPRGGIGGGTRVRIYGSNFLPGSAVRFGGSAATNVVVTSDALVEATTSPSAPGYVDVVVDTMAGSASLPRAYTYQS